MAGASKRLLHSEIFPKEHKPDDEKAHNCAIDGYVNCHPRSLKLSFLGSSFLVEDFAIMDLKAHLGACRNVLGRVGA
jgi:hypothetical protein